MILWHLQLLLYPNVSILLKLVEYTFFDNVIDKNLSIMWYMNGLFHQINCCRFSGLKNTHL